MKMQNLSEDVLVLIWSFDRTRKDQMDHVVHQIRWIPILEELKEHIHFGCFKHYILWMETTGRSLHSAREEMTRHRFRSDEYFDWKKSVFQNFRLFGYHHHDLFYYWKKFRHFRTRQKNEFYV